MPEIVACPSCQRSLRIADEYFGTSVRCPSCQGEFVAGTTPPPARVAPVRNDFDDPSPPPSWPRRDLEPHRGTLILIFGILSLVITCPMGPLGIVAWILGSADLRAMREGRMDPTGEGLTRAGQVCGIISSGLMFLGCFFYLVIVVITAVGAAAR